MRKIFFLLAAAIFSGNAVAGDWWVESVTWDGDGSNPETTFVQASDFHWCPANYTKAQCGSVALSTGTKGCAARSVSVGAEYSYPNFPIGGMKFNYGTSTKQSTCNTQNTKVTCSPNPGYKGRARVNQLSYNATIKLKRTVGQSRTYIWHREMHGGGRGKWPKKRYTLCQYKKI